jgi:VanZ family protein
MPVINNDNNTTLILDDIRRWASRVVLVVLLAAMPWAALSPAASPPSQWAAVMHMASMAVFALLACTGFATLRGRIWAVGFVFVFSALMEGLQHFSSVRSGSWEDVGINALGCLAGGLVWKLGSGGRWTGTR